jgi:SNF2 family DNA or RNA helicase
MGMGKTAVCAALILANPMPRDDKKILKATLVVTNTTLTQQWVDELKKFAPGLLTFYIIYSIYFPFLNILLS